MRWEGVRVESPSLTRVDVTQAVMRDPDALDSDLPEALGLALDEQAPTLTPPTPERGLGVAAPTRTLRPGWGQLCCLRARASLRLSQRVSRQ